MKKFVISIAVDVFAKPIDRSMAYKFNRNYLKHFETLILSAYCLFQFYFQSVFIHVKAIRGNKNIL